MELHSDGHSGATSAATFSVAIAPAPLLFSSPATSGSAAVFLTEKAAALQRCFLSKCSAATPNKLLPTSSRSQKKKVFKIVFQAKKVFKNFFSGDLYLRKPKKRS